jgi:hemolysin (HlyC) family protein
MIFMNESLDKEKNTQKQRSWLEKLTALLAHEPQDREQLMEILRDAEERDILSEDNLGMIERIFHVSEMQVREVMIPKAQMITVSSDHKIDEILPVVIESGHSRFPVANPSGKEIIGILLAKDLLRYYFNKDLKQFQIKEILRPAVFTSQSKRLDILLREFRVNRNHLAIVLDEYGNVAGLVTIEDVLEQIVGDIEDEYDIDEEDYIKQMNDDLYIVKASTPIAEFNEYFKTNFNDEEFDTISGIILQGFEHLPKRGETIKMQNLRFKILNSDNRRIYLLEVKKGKKKESS